ncbi:MAG TPA: sensor domain-containing diguanylate cyclase [Dehalococcoidia bacterium]|nr:sensor domain-containing diguanylate cyclase [Dehalococcoidia bacterium]
MGRGLAHSALARTLRLLVRHGGGARQTLRLATRFSAVWVQVACVFFGSAAIVALSHLALSNIRDRAGSSSASSRASGLAASVTRSVSEIDRLLIVAQPTPSPNSGPVATPALGPGTAVAISRQLATASAAAEELHKLVGSESTLELEGATGDADDFLDRYLDSGKPDDLDAFRYRLTALRLMVDRVAPQLSSTTNLTQASLVSLAGEARTALVGAALLVGLTMAATTWVISRRLRRALRAAQVEQQRLTRTTEAMQRRNEQFQALYQIVSEVTETLSMKYVVQTAVRQARRLVSADMVALRLIREAMLVPVGSDLEAGVNADASASVELGAGVVGRAAKRGKTVRIDAGAAASPQATEGLAGARSGIVVPLIVGARVVGTLECWSRRADCFSADDERILELMASQLATAVVAADPHAFGEHDAHHDPLTNLPNRRQLERDFREQHGPALQEGRSVVFAMLDIDHFKRFNDEHGHKIGDITLQRVAEVVRAGLRDHDFVYRYGGEEFVGVSYDVNDESASDLLERIRNAVGRMLLTGEDLQPLGPVTISVGLALAPEHGSEPGPLLTLADRALYQSKRAGRNCVTLYRPELLELLPAV